MNPNIIRPPVLNHNQPGSSNAIPQSDNPSTPRINATPELEALISTIVRRIVASECRSTVESIINPNNDLSGIDQTIDESNSINFSELDKVPDVVRCLRDFSGNPIEYSSWRKSVERILALYDPIKGTPRYYGILSVVRNKIIGGADNILESYNTPLKWDCIVKCLNLHYADKRDINTLEYQLTAMVQGSKTIQDFYQEVYMHLSLIINKISCMEIGAEAMQILTRTYRNKALDTFIRGLKGDLPRLLGIREPVDLPQALQLCLKLENQQFRAQFSAYTQNNIVDKKPLIPPRRNNSNNHMLPKQFYPQAAYLPQLRQANIPTWPQKNPTNFQQFNNQNMVRPYLPQYNNYDSRPPPRPVAPKPLPAPVPMEIDQTFKTKDVNYLNNPRNNNKNIGKRPLPTSLQTQQPYKWQRNYHIDTLQSNDSNEHYDNAQIAKTENYEYDQSWEEYLNDYPEYGNNVNEPTDDNTDMNDTDPIEIHFLE